MAKTHAPPVLEDGTLSSQDSILQKPQPQIGDAGPLGLGAFAFTTFVMALFNLSVGGISVPNIIIGPALAYGGLGQLVAGMWDMAAGKTVSATIATTYACFWLSFAVILIPGFGIQDAYPSLADYNHGMGCFMLGFLIFSLAITAASIRGPVPFAILTVLVNCTWLSLTVANFWTDEFGASNVVFKKIGGVFGLLVSFTAWYLMGVGLVEKR